MLIYQEKDALRNCSWTAIFQDLQSNHMGPGLFQFALPIVIQPEQCAFVGKEQNIRIVLWPRHVALNSSKNIFACLHVLNYNVW